MLGTEIIASTLMRSPHPTHFYMAVSTTYKGDIVLKTVIAVDVEVREALNSMGKKGESYNDVLRRIPAIKRRLQHG